MSSAIICYDVSMNDILPPQTAQDYITLVKQLAAITSHAMDYLERNKPISLASLDRIAQNVGTVASLRGDSGIYEDTRPIGLSDYQKEMYLIEDQLRARLIGLGYQYPSPRSVSEV